MMGLREGEVIQDSLIVIQYVFRAKRSKDQQRGHLLMSLIGSCISQIRLSTKKAQIELTSLTPFPLSDLYNLTEQQKQIFQLQRSN